MTRQLPIRRNRFQTAQFLAYLSENGCEVGKPSNPYEVVRYRAYRPDSQRPVTHIVYAKQTGLLNWMDGTQGHYHSFLAGVTLVGQSPPFAGQFDGIMESLASEMRETAAEQESKAAKMRAKLIKRDGADCWFCGVDMGDDITIEHLIAKSNKGPNALANYALAHAKCNNDAGNLPLVAKIAMRERLRNRERVL